jgi:peptidoglycan/xylan/chitin deacetylase (PgdA/CDA1 family)
MSMTLSEDLNNTKYFQVAGTFPSWASCNGKCYYAIRKDQFVTKVGTPAWANIRYLEFFAASSVGDTFAIALTKLSYYPRQSKAVITIGFDDGDSTCITNALSILDTRGLKAIFYAIPWWTQGHANDSFRGPFMTPRNFDTMYAHGMDIGNHTWSHPRMDTVSNNDSLKYEFVACYNWLCNHNYRTARFMAYPWGVYTEQTSAFSLPYCDLARVTTPTGETYPITRRWMTKLAIGAEKTMDSILHPIDTVLKYGGLCQLIFHYVETDSAYNAETQYHKNFGWANYITIANFTALMDSIVLRQAAGNPVKTLSQIFIPFKKAN